MSDRDGAKDALLDELQLPVGVGERAIGYARRSYLRGWIDAEELERLVAVALGLERP